MPKLDFQLGSPARKNQAPADAFVLEGDHKSYSLPLLECLDWLDAAKASGSDGSLKSSCTPAAKLEGVVSGRI